MSYSCLDVISESEFVNFVFGMIPLIDDITRLIYSYAINHTNKYTYGIPFEKLYNNFKPNKSAIFFVSFYPEFGEYSGGEIKNDPIFVMWFTASTNEIPGYELGLLLLFSLAGVSFVLLKKYRFKFRP